MNFSKLKKQVADNFKILSASPELYVLPIDRDLIFEKYLGGFEDPEEKQIHTCNCCKSFLRQYAGVVMIENNKIISIWDGIENEEFEGSLNNIRDYLKTLKISGVFLTEDKHCGTDRSRDKKRDIPWEHFYFKAPNKFISSDIDTIKGNKRTTKEVFQRSLEELTVDSVETILELIGQNSLYRGSEHKANLTKFLKLQKKYSKLKEDEKDNFAWAEAAKTSASITRIRNTAIGTLIIDLSEGMDLDRAVTRYEKVTAPTNYKRPTALVTPKMVAAAKEKIHELGLQDALERRYAKVEDLSVEKILYFHKPSAINDVFDEASSEAVTDPRSLSKVETISIEDFIANVVPNSKSMEVLLENSHLKNLASLITSDCEDNLFKWDNPFSWYYTGGITDSIKERVKAAGGSVDGKLRASLSWTNSDDLDIHCITPKNKEIYYGSRRHNGGELDVDMNAGGRHSLTPVENIIWKNSYDEGKYEVFVHNFTRRGNNNQGFVVEIEFHGQIFEFTHNSNNVSRHSIKFEIRNGELRFTDGTTSKPVVKNQWGLNTNTFHKVKVLTTSPNFWDDNKVGNKHYFFMLDGAKNDESPRSIFNEFLRNDLDKHRKVFEVVGSKLKVEDSDEQLSGLGFSDTVRNHVYVKVEGKFSRTLKVTF